MEQTRNIPFVDEWRIDASGAVDDKEDPIVSIDPEDSYVYPDGATIRINLLKMFGKDIARMAENNPDAACRFDTLNFKRDAYINKIDIICQYIDYFITFFDPDKELPMIYLHIKDAIDSAVLKMTPVELKNMIIQELILKSDIKTQIYAFVDYNNNIDVTIDPKSGRRYIEPDDFTNEDARRLLAVSLAMKLVIPLIEQYKSVSVLYNKGSWAHDISAEMMVELFYQFGQSPTRAKSIWTRKKVRKNRPNRPWEKKIQEEGKKEPEVDETDLLLTKVYRFIMKRVKKHHKNNAGIWSQHGALRGLTETKKGDELLSKYIFYDNFFKLNFRFSIVSLLQSIVETQLHFTIISVKYKKNPIEIDHTPDANGLSSADKVEQSLPKIDETLVIRANISTETVLEQIIEEVGPISDDEIEYYRTHCVRNNSNSVQEIILQNFFAKRYNGFTELKTMPDRYHIKLLIAMKRILEKQGNYQMSYFLSATTVGKTSNRMLQNQKYMNKLKSSPTYEKLTNVKYKALQGLDQPDMILVPISRALNNKYTFVEYSAPELYGQTIQFDEDIISNEIMDTIDAI